MTKRTLNVFLFFFLFPFILSAEGTRESGAGGWEIPNLISKVIAANPGDYILLDSGNRYVLTRDEIETARANYDNSVFKGNSSLSSKSDDAPYLAASYHLMVLDRLKSPLNSDIDEVSNIKLLYKYKHGRNGYLIAMYTSLAAGPVYPRLPVNSRIIVDIVSATKIPLKDYINSAAFKKFVSNRRVLADMQRVL